MGRPRTTGCTRRHWPDELCQECARIRAERSRRRRRDKPATAIAVGVERAALDQQATDHRAKLTKAYAKVDRAIRRGTIAPPTTCERCGLPAHARPARPSTRKSAHRTARLRDQRAGLALHAWLPDPANHQEIAWLCTLCRKRIRATREPLTLRWTWPGMPATKRGRPHANDLTRHTAVARATTSALGAQTAERGFTELADVLFFATLTRAAGERAEALYAQGLRAALRGRAWTPLGEPELDAQLRRWITYERGRREADATTRPPLKPADAWERRTRRDRLPPTPVEPPTTAPRPAQPFDENAALEQLAAAEAAYGAVAQRVIEALERGTRTAP